MASASSSHQQIPTPRSGSKSPSSFPSLYPLHDALPPASLSSSAPCEWTLDSLSSITTASNAVVQTRKTTTASANATPIQSSVDSSKYFDHHGAANRHVLPSPMPLELPESVLSMNAYSSTLTTKETIGTASGIKPPGLMRRLSRGAANKLTRRRQSTSHHTKRDNSSGPVIMRRRSDSKTGTSNSRESALESSHEEGEACDSLGMWYAPEGNNMASEYRISMATVSGVAPKVDSLLQRGSVLTKVSKHRKKQKTFFLDLDSGKVYWDLSNPAKRLYIDDIKEIRIGSDARNYREEHQVPEDCENRWFTIIFANPEGSTNRRVKAMHLIAPNETVFELWTTTLEHISRYRIGLMVGLAGSSQSETILRAHWLRELTRRFPQGLKPGEEECLDLGAIENLCHSLHINCSKSVLRAQFLIVDVKGRGKVDFAQFTDFVQRLKERKDICGILTSIAEDTIQGLSLDEFLNFLRNIQAEDVDADKEHWVSIFEKFVRRSKIRSQSLPEPLVPSVARMNLDAFSSFLMSSANSVYPSQAPPPGFDQPLNDYFISSSHNTYLLGRQVAGASSTEAYITALQKGCRCVEIDCWDGADGRPIVSHGRTMTTSVLFSDCINVINRYAFLSSEYPLILSLEVHCNSEQQLAMASIMKDVFGDQLLLEPLREDWPILPSPEALKRRILVKVKTSDETENGVQNITSNPQLGRKRSSSSPFTYPISTQGSLAPTPIPLPSPPTVGPIDGLPQKLTPGRRSLTGTSSSASEESDVPQGAVISPKEMKKLPKSRIVKGLADLGVYTRGYKWRGFNTPESKRYNHVYSFAERAFDVICRDPENKALLEAHNRLYLTRVYPSGFRLRSSNFDPNIFWRRGVQMVALNWQTYDVGMQMNQAMFASGTDRTGYILKPESLRTPPSARPTIDGKPKIDRKLVRFSVDIISAQQLPRLRGMGPDDNINPYIEIEILSADDKKKGVAYGEGGMNASARNGMSGIGLPHRRRTRIEQKNGFNPIYNDQFRFSLETKYPDLVFVRWIVWNSLDGRSVGGNNSVQLATFTAKLSSLSQGYRYLPLYDGSGDQYLFSTLFCKVSKYSLLPAHYRDDVEDTKIERMGIFRQIGQSVFKRALSTEREKEREYLRERAKSTGSSQKSDDTLARSRTSITVSSTPSQVYVPSPS